MRQFASPGYKISKLPFGMRIVYTFFLVLIAAGYGSNFFLQYAKTGLTYQGFVQYYRGNMDEVLAEDELENTEEISEMTLREPMSFIEILLTTHMHLFIMPVIYLILVHMFFMTSLGPRLKMAGMVLPFIGLTLDLICPWLIRFVAPQFAALKLFSVALMASALFFLVLIPMIDMWKSQKEGMTNDEIPGGK